ncbi:MAG TPA: hypothetical protein ENF93_00025 [Ignisphaera sp.]|nr:hypothetical protein [Ignisphaera sp.]
MTTSIATVSQALVLGEGDWLKYRLKMHGKGPLGEMDIEAEIRIYVEKVGKDFIRLRIEPLTKLSQEESSLVMLASMTGNKIFLAIAGAKSISVDYSLPLKEPSTTCPIIAKPIEKRIVTGGGEILGHKYSVECKYTPKGILQEMKFRDTFSSGGQTLESEATLTLIEASKDVGLSQEKPAGGLGGIDLSNPIVIGGIIGAVIIIAVVVVVLARKK